MTVDGIGGVLVVDKPTGPTSHDVVARTRRVLGIRRVGHCGTLDPLATGVLVLCVGPMTRFSRWLTGGDKEYEACFRLGATSDTDDALGEITETPAADPIPRSEIETALKGFLGVIDQVPPEHSAVRVRGVRSYHRARRKEATGLVPRPVRVDRFEIVGYEPPRLRVHVSCGQGTYIRSLARDLGQVLGCGGLVETIEAPARRGADDSRCRRMGGPGAADRGGHVSERTPGLVRSPRLRRDRQERGRGLLPWGSRHR